MVLLTVNHTAREVSHLARLTQPTGWILPGRYRKTDYAPAHTQVRSENPGMRHVIDGRRASPRPRWPTIVAAALEGQPARCEQDAGSRPRAPTRATSARSCPQAAPPACPRARPAPTTTTSRTSSTAPRPGTSTSPTPCLVATTVGHNLALLISLCGPVFHAAKHGLVDSTYPQDVCRAIEAERVTCAALVPTLMSRLVAYEGVGDARPLDPGTGLRRRRQLAARPGAIGRAPPGLPLRERLRHGRGPLLAVAPRGPRVDPLRDHRPSR